MPRHHFVILMDAMGWRVLQFQRMRLLAWRTLDGSEQSRQQLLVWIQQVPGAQVSFISNLPDEYDHFEEMPVVRGAAAFLLLSRRLAAWSGAGHLHAIHRLQPSHQFHRYVFSAIDSPTLVGWLPALEQAGVRVRGIYLQSHTLFCWLPQLLGPNMPPPSAHVLCIQVSPLSVRISYSHHHQLVHSQSLWWQDASTGSSRQRPLASALQQAYLNMLQQPWFKAGVALHVLCLGGDAEDMPSLQALLPADSVWRFCPQEALCAAADGLPSSALPECMDWLAVRSVLSGCRLPNLAPPRTLLLHRALQLRPTLHAMGTLLLLMLLCLGWLVEQTRQQLEAERQAMMVHMQATPSPQASVPSRERVQALQAMDAVSQTLVTSLRLPDQALVQLMPVCRGLKFWQLRAIDWQSSGLSSVSAMPSQAVKVPGAQIRLTWLGLGAPALVDAGPLQQEWQRLLLLLRRLPMVSQLTVQPLVGTHGQSEVDGRTDQWLGQRMTRVVTLTLQDDPP